MRIVYLALFLVVIILGCRKTPNNSNAPVTMPPPSTPVNPPATTPSYAKYRIPLPGWGTDTLICRDTMNNDWYTVDSLFCSVGPNGESWLFHNGKKYFVWIDTFAHRPDTNNYYGLLNNVGIGGTINDTFSLVPELNTWYQFPLTKTDTEAWYGNHVPRNLQFSEPLFNSKAYNNTWLSITTRF